MHYVVKCHNDYVVLLALEWLWYQCIVPLNQIHELQSLCHCLWYQFFFIADIGTYLSSFFLKFKYINTWWVTYNYVCIAMYGTYILIYSVVQKLTFCLWQDTWLIRRRSTFHTDCIFNWQVLLFKGTHVIILLCM